MRILPKNSEKDTIERAVVSRRPARHSALLLSALFRNEIIPLWLVSDRGGPISTAVIPVQTAMNFNLEDAHRPLGATPDPLSIVGFRVPSFPPAYE